MLIRVGWRDLIFAVVWLVAIAVPLRVMFTFITGPNDVWIVAALPRWLSFQEWSLQRGSLVVEGSHKFKLDHDLAPH